MGKIIDAPVAPGTDPLAVAIANAVAGGGGATVDDATVAALPSVAAKAEDSRLNAGGDIAIAIASNTSGLAAKADVTALAAKADVTALAGKADATAVAAKADDSRLNVGGDIGDAVAANTAELDSFEDANKNLKIGTSPGTEYTNPDPLDKSNVILGGGAGVAVPNVIDGPGNYRAIAGGYDNLITGDAAAPATASGLFGTMHAIITKATHALGVGGSLNKITKVNVPSSEGDYSAFLGGLETEITGSHAGAVAGLRNKLFGSRSSAAGGEDILIGKTGEDWGDFSATAGGLNLKIGELVKGRLSFLGGGQNNEIGSTLDVTHSAGIGGSDTCIDASYAGHVGAREALMKFAGQVWSGGMLLAKGDAQTTRTTVKVISTSSTLKILAPGGPVLAIPDNTVWTMHAVVNGVKDDGTKFAAYTVQAVIKRAAGAASSTVQAVNVAVVAAEASWSQPLVTVSTTTGAVSIRVFGADGDRVHWTGHVDIDQTSVPG